MPRKKNTLILSLWLLSALQFSVLAKNTIKWEQLSAKDGIVVHRRQVPGSSLMQFRGRGIIPDNIVRLLAVMNDTDAASEWIDQSLGLKRLKTLSNKSFIFYSATKVPWPFKDRDFVGKATMYINNKKGVIVLKSVSTTHAKAPPRSDRVRMKFIRVYWTFKPLSINRTWVEFKVHADPGGNIPDWLSNIVSKSLPHNTIANFRKRVRSNKVRKEFIELYRKKYEHWGWDKEYMKEYILIDSYPLKH